MLPRSDRRRQPSAWRRLAAVEDSSAPAAPAADGAEGRHHAPPLPDPESARGTKAARRSPLDVFVEDGAVGADLERRQRAAAAIELYAAGAARHWVPPDSREKAQSLARFAIEYSAGTLAGARTAIIAFEAFCAEEGESPWTVQTSE